MSSMHKPRGIWLWFRVLAVVALGLLVLPLLSPAAGADSGYGGPGQPVGTQGAEPQQNTGAGASATSDGTTTSDSLSTDSRSTDGVSGQDTGSAGTTGPGPAFLAPASAASSSTASSVAPKAAAVDTTTPAGDNAIVVRKHADTTNGKLIDTATFQLWKDNGNGVLDTPSASTSSTSTSSSASLTTPSSPTSPAAVDTATGAAVDTGGGTATWAALPGGRYIVQEVAAPSGYQLPSANDSPVDFPSGSPGQTKTVDFADVKLSTSPTPTETTSTAAVSTATATPGTGAVGLAPPAGPTTGGGTLPGVGAPPYLLLVGLAGLASLAGGGWLLSHRRPRGAHAQP